MIHTEENVSERLSLFNCILVEFDSTKRQCYYECNLHKGEVQKCTKFFEMYRKRRKFLCRFCCNEHKSVTQRGFKDENELAQMFLERNLYLLPNQKCIKNTQRLKFTCKIHAEEGVQDVSWTQFRIRTGGCCKCGKESLIEKLKKYSIEDIETIFKKQGCTLLSTNYKTVDDHLYYICKNGHSTRTNLTNFQKGHGCWECGVEMRSGKNHYLWEYGSSPLYRHLRSAVKPWVFDSLKKYNFKCYITGTKDELQVHHAIINFATMAKEVISKYGLSMNDCIGEVDDRILKCMSKDILDMHYFYGLGYPITAELHTEFHQRYGKYDNTMEQFMEFIENIQENKPEQQKDDN